MKRKQYIKGHFIPIGLAVGLPIGIPIGMLLGHIALGPAIGLPIGLIIGAIELYPQLLYANNNIENSITIYNAASSDKSLGIMLLFVAVGVPLIIGYTYFVYKAFWGKVELDETSY